METSVILIENIFLVMINIFGQNKIRIVLTYYCSKTMSVYSSDRLSCFGLKIEISNALDLVKRKIVEMILLLFIVVAIGF